MRFQFFLIRGKRWNLCFLLRFMFVIFGKRDFVLFEFLAHFADMLCQSMVVSDLFRFQEDVKPLLHYACWRSDDERYVVLIWFLFDLASIRRWRRGFSSFLFAGRVETSVCDLFVFVIIGKRDLFCLISRSFCGHEDQCCGGFRSFSLSGRCETTVDLGSHACWISEEDGLIFFFFFDLFLVWRT